MRTRLIPRVDEFGPTDQSVCHHIVWSVVSCRRLADCAIVSEEVSGMYTHPRVGCDAYNSLLQSTVLVRKQASYLVRRCRMITVPGC